MRFVPSVPIVTSASKAMFLTKPTDSPSGVSLGQQIPY